MTDKEFVLSIYPDAKCTNDNSSTHQYTKYVIIKVEQILAISFISEEMAWQWAAKTINSKILTQFSK
jgi:hypothetical protein